MVSPLRPAHLHRNAEGIPASSEYGDIYHAAAGGPGQARHVFLGGNDLPQRWRTRERFVILENGFGTGLNFLATWSAWRDDPQRPACLHYLAVEQHPFRVEDMASLHADWPEFADLAAQLRAAWPVLTPGFHRIGLAGGKVVLTLMLGDSATCLTRLRARVDAIYLDGFDPKCNPEMWSPAVCKALARVAAPDATLATWCVARSVRDALAQAGFTTHKRPGFAGKRDMLTASPSRPLNTVPPVRTGATPRHALIIGAGIAGCALAHRLATRGWQIDLIERGAGLASAGSGNLAGVFRPMLARDDNFAARINRACFLYAQHLWNALDEAGHVALRGLNGVLQIARDTGFETQQRDLAASGDYPQDFVRFLERDAASALLGQPLSLGGWWFPRGGWVSPPSVCAALIAAAGAQVRLRFGQDVAALQHDGTLWQAMDATGGCCASAPVAILASGVQTTQLAQAAALRIWGMRGQVSHLPAGALPTLPHALCRDGYLTPAVQGIHCLGASYVRSDETMPTLDEHINNLVRLEHMLPGSSQGIDPAALLGRVGFRAVTPDRLPMVGALPDASAPLPGDMRLRSMPRHANLYGLLGLGSRGLVWATLAAEVLASQINGDPLPLEGELIDALDPARFMLRTHRRGTPA